MYIVLIVLLRKIFQLFCIHAWNKLSFDSLVKLIYCMAIVRAESRLLRKLTTMFCKYKLCMLYFTIYALSQCFIVFYISRSSHSKFHGSEKNFMFFLEKRLLFVLIFAL